MKLKMLTAVLVLAGGLAWGDEVVLFSAANAGPDIWSWEGAKLKVQEEGLVLTPANAELCAVVLQERYVWMPRGQIRIEVKQAVAGTFTLQVLAFKGDAYLGALDVILDSSQKGLFTMPFERLVFPKGTESITFKFWVSRSVGTAITFGDLEYVLPIAAEQIVYDKKIDAATEAIPDRVSWTPSDNGGRMQLLDEGSIGSVVFPDQIPKPDGGRLLLQVKDVKSGTLTAQVCAFDANTEYLDSRDIVRQATAGVSGNLAAVAWPEGTATFQIKVWLGGAPNASAVIQRILVLR